MVSKASDDLPEPESPVNTISRLRGSSSEMFFRLRARAPLMTMESVDMARPRRRAAIVPPALDGISGVGFGVRVPGNSWPVADWGRWAKGDGRYHELAACSLQPRIRLLANCELREARSGRPWPFPYTPLQTSGRIRPMFRQIGGGEIILILAVLLLLFGSTKLPAWARALGKSARARAKGLG